jgi:transcriptional regulator GlxA family with amidase domain
MPEPFRPTTDKPLTVSDPSAGRRRVVAVAVPKSDPLELIGPVEVLVTTNIILQQAGLSETLGYDIEVVAPQTGTVFSWNGMKLVAEKSFKQVRGPVDTLLVQALDWNEESLRDRKFVDWLGRTGKKVRRCCAICTGAYLLAEAGLLENRRATLHWAWAEDLQARYPNIQVEPDPIFIKDDHIYTSAGATAGLDLMLALVEEDFGRDVALKVAQFMVLFLKRPGNQAQFSAQLSSNLAEKDSIRDVQAWIVDHLDEDLSVETLAENTNMSPRNFSRVFTREVGTTPGRYVEQARLERARQYLEESKLPVGRVASTCGYGTSEAMRLAFVRRLGIAPREYRQRFASAR